MNRRKFINSLACGAVAIGAGGGAASAARPAVSITMDDFALGETPKLTAVERNRRTLDALRERSNLKAALFVTGKYVDNETGKRLLAEWDREGHTIANHSYSHLYYNSAKTDFETFSKDILRGEAVIREFPRFRKLFRFPYLKEGETPEKRDLLRRFLKEQGYRVGHVTIDASDWYVDSRLRERLKKDPNAQLAPYRDYYLDHIWERATYYDDLAKRVIGRSCKHTLLIHFNLLNALFLGDLLKMFEKRGWKLINAGEAFEDPVFASSPDIAPAGESIIWALAKESGKHDRLLRYPGEDGVYEKAKMDKLGL